MRIDCCCVSPVRARAIRERARRVPVLAADDRVRTARAAAPQWPRDNAPGWQDRLLQRGGYEHTKARNGDPRGFLYSLRGPEFLVLTLAARGSLGAVGTMRKEACPEPAHHELKLSPPVSGTHTVAPDNDRASSRASTPLELSIARPSNRDPWHTNHRCTPIRAPPTTMAAFALAPCHIIALLYLNKLILELLRVHGRSRGGGYGQRASDWHWLVGCRRNFFVFWPARLQPFRRKAISSTASARGTKR